MYSVDANGGDGRCQLPESDEVSSEKNVLLAMVLWFWGTVTTEGQQKGTSLLRFTDHNQFWQARRSPRGRQRQRQRQHTQGKSGLDETGRSIPRSSFLMFHTDV